MLEAAGQVGLHQEAERKEAGVQPTFSFILSSGHQHQEVMLPRVQVDLEVCLLGGSESQQTDNQY